MIQTKTLIELINFIESKYDRFHIPELDNINLVPYDDFELNNNSIVSITTKEIDLSIVSRLKNFKRDASAKFLEKLKGVKIDEKITIEKELFDQSLDMLNHMSVDNPYFLEHMPHFVNDLLKMMYMMESFIHFKNSHNKVTGALIINAKWVDLLQQVFKNINCKNDLIIADIAEDEIYMYNSSLNNSIGDGFNVIFMNSINNYSTIYEEKESPIKWNYYIKNDDMNNCAVKIKMT